MFDHLVDNGAYSEADAARLIREVASAVAFLHGIDVVHADLKPEVSGWMDVWMDPPSQFTLRERESRRLLFLIFQTLTTRMLSHSILQWI